MAEKTFTYRYHSSACVVESIPINVETQLKSELTPGLPLLSQSCDYCNSDIRFVETMIIEAVRYKDLEGFSFIEDRYKRWIPSRSRCSRCETDSITPGTVEIEEALLKIKVDWRHGRWCIENTDFEILDYSSSEDGYLSPDVVGLRTVSQRRSPKRQIQAILGMEAARWFVINWRLKQIFPRQLHDQEEARRNSPAGARVGFDPHRDLPPEVIETVKSLLE